MTYPKPTARTWCGYESEGQMDYSVTARNKRPDKRAAFTQAVVKVGNGGRGFVVETEQGKRIVITAAHCVAADGSDCRQHTRGLTPRSASTRACSVYSAGPSPVSTKCLFADPLADIAVLGSPDNQELPDEAEAYEELTRTSRPSPLRTRRSKAGSAPRSWKRYAAAMEPASFAPGRKFHPTLEIPTPGLGAALLLSLDGKWLKRSVKRRGPCLSLERETTSKAECRARRSYRWRPGYRPCVYRQAQPNPSGSAAAAYRASQGSDIT